MHSHNPPSSFANVLSNDNHCWEFVTDAEIMDTTRNNVNKRKSEFASNANKPGTFFASATNEYVFFATKQDILLASVKSK